MKITIIGAGGFAKEVLELIIDIEVAKKFTAFSYINDVCFAEPDKVWKKRKIYGVNVIPESKIDFKKTIIVVGVGDSDIRSKIIKKLPKYTKFMTLIHPNAKVSKFSDVGDGCIICDGSIISCDVNIKNHTIINNNATIGHDNNIGEFFTASPGVNISGYCTIGDRVYFGANSCIKERLTVCDDVLIGMGGVVVKNITKSGVYVGNPVKKIK